MALHRRLEELSPRIESVNLVCFELSLAHDFRGHQPVHQAGAKKVDQEHAEVGNELSLAHHEQPNWDLSIAALYGALKVSFNSLEKIRVSFPRLAKTIVCGALFTAICTAAQATAEDPLVIALRAKDQALLDAIAPGNRSVWEAELAPDFLYVDENNHILDRSQFLQELTPLPTGTTGKLSIVSYQLHRTGDTAVVVHRDDEREQYFGSSLQAQYLMTETWQLSKGHWKLRVVHAAAIPVDAPTITLSSEKLDQFVGTYRAGTLTYVIRRDATRLFGGRPGGPEAELKPETRDVLIVPGQPRSRKVFSRDSNDAVTGFADRRENRDLVWTRGK